MKKIYIKPPSVFYGSIVALSLFTLFVLHIPQAHAGSCAATATGNWTTTTWSAGCGGVGGIPTTGDDVTINSGITVTLDVDTPVLNTLTVTGTLNTSSSNFAVNTAALTVTVTTGTLIANASTITLSGTSGTLFTRGGTFTQGTSNVIVTSASGTPTLLSASTTFYKLTINSTATVINTDAALTIQNAAGAKLYVQAGVLNISAAGTGSGATNGTLQIDSGATLCLGGTVSATVATCDSGTTSASGITIPTFQTYTLDPASTVIYLSNSNGLGLSDTAITFGNVTLRPVLTNAFVWGNASDGTTTIAGNFDLNPSGGATGSFHQVSFNLQAPLIVAGTTTIEGHTSSVAGFSQLASNGIWPLTTQRIVVAAGVSNLLNGNNMTINLTGTSGTLFSNSANWSQAGSTVNVISASGTPTLVTAATNFAKLSINSAATVVNATGAITISNVSTSKLYVQSGVFNPAAGVTGSGGSNGTLQIDSGATLCLGGTTSATNATCDSGATQTTARTMPTFLTYTLDPASTVRYLSDAATTISQTPTYGNLTFTPVLTAGRTYTLGGAMTVNGNWDINPNSAGANLLTVNAGGTMTIASGKTTTIERQGSNATSSLVLRVSAVDYNLSTGLLNIATGGTLDATSAASTITLSGTSGTLFTRVGSFTITSGTPTLTLSGNGSATVNSGTLTLYNLTSSGTGTKSLGGVITVNNNMTVSGGTFADAGNQITGNGTGTLTQNSGTTLSFGAGTATTFPTSFTSGHISLDPSSTVIYNATTAQTISGTPSFYGSLQLSAASGTPTKTLGGAITLLGALTIDSGNTLDVSGSNYTIDVNSHLINNGTFTARNGAVLVSGGSQQTVSGTWTGSSSFYDLTLDNNSGIDPSDAELTNFIPGIIFAGSVTATHNNVITTPQSRIQFNNGSTYTFNNINWAGSAGNLIYFRNSATSGHWNVDVSGTQTAVTYINVSRSDASGGNTIASNLATVVNGGNTINWGYNNDPDAPSLLGPTSYTDGSLSYNATPTLTFTLNDEDGSDTVAYEIVISTHSDFSDPVVDYTSALAANPRSTSFQVGQIAGGGSYTVGSSGQTLADNSYYFEVKAIDSNSAASSFTLANGGAVAFVIASITSSTTTGSHGSLLMIPPPPQLQSQSSGVSPNPVSVSFIFTRILKQGNQNNDVLWLQKYLNTHGFIIAKSGLGSPGNETNYFGKLTKLALIKFQEAHRAEMLAPFGLTKGTGNFGRLTLQYINLNH